MGQGLLANAKCEYIFCSVFTILVIVSNVKRKLFYSVLSSFKDCPECLTLYSLIDLFSRTHGTTILGSIQPRCN